MRPVVFYAMGSYVYSKKNWFGNMTQRNINALLGVLGILALSILLLWFPYVVLRVPMPKDMVAYSVVNVVWVVLATCVLPYFWAVKRLGMRLDELGLVWNRLGRDLFLGCGLYSIALVAFLYCSGDDLIANHAVGQEPFGRAMILMLCMGIVAAGTDLLTRGYVLLTLTKHTHVIFAIIMQNLVWFTGHLQEIKLLTNCLGTFYAVLLTLVLGIIGDMIVLRTKSVVGLAAAHFILNVILTIYIRW